MSSRPQHGCRAAGCRGKQHGAGRGPPACRPGDEGGAAAAPNFAVEHLSESIKGYSRAKNWLNCPCPRLRPHPTISAVMAEVEAAENDGCRLVRELPLYQTARSLNQAKKNEDDKQVFAFHGRA